MNVIVKRKTRVKRHHSVGLLMEGLVLCCSAPAGITADPWIDWVIAKRGTVLCVGEKKWCCVGFLFKQDPTKIYPVPELKRYGDATFAVWERKP